MLVPASTTRALRRVGWLSLGAALALGVAALVLGWTQGWRWFDVTTPSMGTAAPVGSLVVTQPSRIADLVVGDVIVFTNPRGTTYSHRVVELAESGVFTKGDINGAVDPWPTTDANLVGRAAQILPNIGFLLRGLPWLIVGLLLVQLLVRFVQPRWRSQARFLLTVLVIDAVLVIVHPLVGIQPITYAGVPGGIEARLVSTGILPVSITGAGGEALVLHQGEVGSVVSELVDGKAVFLPGLAWDWFWLLVAAVIVLLPLAWSLLIGFRVPAEAESAEERGDGGEGQDAAAAGTALSAAAVGGTNGLTSIEDLLQERSGSAQAAREHPWYRSRWVLRSSVAVAALALLGGLTLSPRPAAAAFTAKVRENTTGAGTRQFFTCLDAIRGFNDHPKGELYVGYALGGGSGVAAATDQSGRGYNVTTTGGIAAATTRGCFSDAIVRGQRGWTLNGSTSGIVGNASALIAPSAGAVNDSDALTWTLWFRTTSTTGGVLTCSSTAAQLCTDRTTWLTDSGRLAFQVGTSQLLTSSTWNDGSWHFMAAQLSRTQGMRLWVDGVQRAANPGVTAGTAVSQRLQWGYSTGAIPVAYANRPTNVHFGGDLQMAAVISETAAGPIGQSEIEQMYLAATP